MHQSSYAEVGFGFQIFSLLIYLGLCSEAKAIDLTLSISPTQLVREAEVSLDSNH